MARNRTAVSRHFRIRIRLENGTAKVSGVRHYAEVSTGDYLIAGRNLSCVYRYGNFNAVTIPKDVGTSFEEIWSTSVLDGRLVACVAEFTVGSPSAATTLVVQTCCDNGTPPGDNAPSLLSTSTVQMKLPRASRIRISAGGGPIAK